MVFFPSRIEEPLEVAGNRHPREIIALEQNPAYGLVSPSIESQFALTVSLDIANRCRAVTAAMAEIACVAKA